MVSAGGGGPSPLIATHISMLESENQLWSDLEAKIIAFWDMPLPKREGKPSEIDYCEEIYRKKHYRLQNGRYVVPIPWNPEAPELGDSYNRALKFFYGQEFRWINNKEHKQKSDDFMSKYIDLGHMTLFLQRKARRRTERYSTFHTFLSCGRTHSRPSFVTFSMVVRKVTTVSA